jgi:hypothetical protein
MGWFRVRNHHRFPISQNVRKRDSPVRAALGLFQKADCDRSGDRIARGCLAGVRAAGEHCEGSDTSAAIFLNRLEDGLQDSLFGSTEHAEVKDSRQVDRLLSHDRLKLHLVPVDPVHWLSRPALGAGLVALRQTFVRRCHGGSGSSRSCRESANQNMPAGQSALEP